jgi:hypothetical protein
MKNTLKSTFISLALLLLSAPADAQTRETFDFRGLTLGMTLDEARNMRMDSYPDLQTANLVCTGDPVVGPISYFAVHLTAPEAAAGIRRCAYYNPPRVFGPGPGSTFDQEAILSIGSQYSTGRLGYGFDFFPDPETGVLRLYHVRVQTNANAFEEVRVALEAKFGQPTRTSTEPVQNGMGAVFNSTVVSWRREDATLNLYSRSGRVDRMAVVYRLTGLSRAAEAAVRAAQANGPNGM